MEGKRISQAAIARELGISQALVSMILNGRKQGIAKSTYDLVWKTAQAAGYMPRGMQVDSLMSKSIRKKTVGYFLRSPIRLANQSNFFSHITQGLHDYFTEAGIHLSFLGSEMDYADPLIKSMKELKPHLIGIVVLGEIQEKFQTWIASLGIPTVMVSGRAPGVFHSVNPNEETSARMLIDHLVELGHQQIGYLGSGFPAGRNQERLDSVRKSLAAHNLSLDPRHVVLEKEAGRKNGYTAMESLLKRKKPHPTAVVCMNATLARGAITCLDRKAIRVGKDFSIVAIDQTRVRDEDFPSITAASSIPEKLGSTAAKILLENKDNTEGSLLEVILPAQMTLGDSSGPLPKRQPA